MVTRALAQRPWVTGRAVPRTKSPRDPSPRGLLRSRLRSLQMGRSPERQVLGTYPEGPEGVVGGVGLLPAAPVHQPLQLDQEQLLGSGEGGWEPQGRSRGRASPGRGPCAVSSEAWAPGGDRALARGLNPASRPSQWRRGTATPGWEPWVPVCERGLQRPPHRMPGPRCWRSQTLHGRLCAQPGGGRCSAPGGHWLLLCNYGPRARGPSGKLWEEDRERALGDWGESSTRRGRKAPGRRNGPRGSTAEAPACPLG